MEDKTITLKQFLLNVDLISPVNIDHGHLQGEFRPAECSLYTGETHYASLENCHGMWFVMNTGIVRACASLTFIMSENLGNLLMLFWRTATGLTDCQDFDRSPLSDITIHLPPLSTPCLSSHLASADTSITLVNTTLIDTQVVLELMSWHPCADVRGKNISLKIALQPLLLSRNHISQTNLI